ncbi:hypothetical protein A2U01_0087684, partial [Trifolium medium]|nr:hypothetical protein [Trifolium medium]
MKQPELIVPDRALRQAYGAPYRNQKQTSRPDNATAPCTTHSCMLHNQQQPTRFSVSSNQRQFSTI